MSEPDVATVVSVEVVTEPEGVPFYQGAAAQKLVVWLIFGVLCSLFPIGADYVSATAEDSKVGLMDVLAHGELLIISAVIAAGAVGDVVLSIIRNPKRQIMIKLLSLGFCVVFFGITYIWYGSSKRIEPSAAEGMKIAHGSLLFFGLAFLSSLAGMTVAAGGE